jgi:hypothetical protein
MIGQIRGSITGSLDEEGARAPVMHELGIPDTVVAIAVENDETFVMLLGPSARILEEEDE